MTNAVTTIRGLGQVTAGDAAIPVRYTITVMQPPPPRLGTITGQLVRLDGRSEFFALLGRNDVVLKLEDGRTWGCVLSDMGGAVASRTGITPPPH